MDPLTTGSAMPMAVKCPPSQVLPRVRRSGGKDRPGSALHDHFRDRATFGVEEAMRMLPKACAAHKLDEKETAIVCARARRFEWSAPRGAIPEVALCLLEDGTVQRVKGGRGQYTDLPPGALLPAQLDVMWSEPHPLYLDPAFPGIPRCPKGSTLWVIDFKTGSDDYPDPANHNAQLLSCAMMAARWTGAEAVMPALVYPDEGQGTWDCADAPLGTEQLDEVHALVLDTLARVAATRTAYAAGAILGYTEGPHCRFCDSQAFCAARNASLKAVLSDPMPGRAGAFTAAQAEKLAELLPTIEALAVRAKDALIAYVENTGGPIMFPDGRAWGPNEHVTSALDPAKIREVLVPIVGLVLAEEAARGGKRASIEDAVRAFHTQQGIAKQHGKAMGLIMGKLKSAGGIVEKSTTWHSVYRPKAPIQPRALPDYAGLPIDGDL